MQPLCDNRPTCTTKNKFTDHITSENLQVFTTLVYVKTAIITSNKIQLLLTDVRYHVHLMVLRMQMLEKRCKHLQMGDPMRTAT